MADRPDPAAVELTDRVFMLVTPCHTTDVTLPETSDPTPLQQVSCPAVDGRDPRGPLVRAVRVLGAATVAVMIALTRLMIVCQGGRQAPAMQPPKRDGGMTTRAALMATAADLVGQALNLCEQLEVDGPVELLRDTLSCLTEGDFD